MKTECVSQSPKAKEQTGAKAFLCKLSCSHVYTLGPAIHTPCAFGAGPLLRSAPITYSAACHSGFKPAACRMVPLILPGHDNPYSHHAPSESQRPHRPAVQRAMHGAPRANAPKHP